LLVLVCALLASPIVVFGAQQVPPGTRSAQLSGGTIADIKVVGNQRLEAGTILSYMLVRPGDPFNPDQLDRSLKTLYATGLFADVNLGREGNTLVVRVKENPIVNRVAFEGNHTISDETLRPQMQLKPRAVFTPAIAQSDRQKILDLYAKRGYFAARVEPKIIELPQNRVDVIYEVSDGASTLISRIAFVGNHAFSENRLRDVVESREEAWWRFLSSSDSYDPDRVNYDKELLRRFYLQKGYADFEVTNATAELSPDKASFFLTFTLSEGERYTVANVTVNSTIKAIDKAELEPLVELEPGDWYDGDAVERSVNAISTYGQQHGQPFIEVKPEIKRDQTKHTIDLVFNVGEGPRVYVERINIVGNQRTEDKVIRREFTLAEGDPLNASQIRDTRQRLQDLDFFQNVTIDTEPGSSPDRAIVNTTIQEKATGELTFGGGYASDVGALLSAGLHEKNLIGTGIDAGLNGILAQRETQINLSVTDPYFLDRNIVAGFDLFRTQLNNIDIADYQEKRFGGTLRAGYAFTDHLRQLWSYSLVQREVYDVQPTASLYVQDEAGYTLLSQISQAITLDYRDSKLDPHSGYIIRLGTDLAGLGGNVDYIRTKLDGNYYIPLDTFTGSADWGIALSAGVGYLHTYSGKEQIIDRFFLGGDNLRGFETGGAGPHAIQGGDSLGGEFIWTQSTELRFPLPISSDIGLTGRTFVDIGALQGVQKLIINGAVVPFTDNPAPRVGIGVGVSWKTPFGLINIDVGVPVVKYTLDKSQFIRFGFGTRF
jgi:outer membrane protein insertion porin family